MRIAFLILLLANGLLFFWGQSRLGTGGGVREPGRMTQQVAPDSVHIVPADALKSPPAPLPAGTVPIPPPA